MRLILGDIFPFLFKTNLLKINFEQFKTEILLDLGIHF